MTGRVEVHAPAGIGEVHPGADLAGLVVDHVPDLADGDVLVLTSKVVSKAEGRLVDGDREDVIRAETVRLVARRGRTAPAVLRCRRGRHRQDRDDRRLRRVAR